MAINKYRWVRYDEDGVDRYECLKCRAIWCMRGTPGPFCSYCGARWDGELVWNTEERQAYDQKVAEAVYGRRREPRALWQLQVRVLWQSDLDGRFRPLGGSDWKDEGLGFEIEKYSAKMVLAIVAERRRWHEADRAVRVEYRVVLRMPEQRQGVGA